MAGYPIAVMDRLIRKVGEVRVSRDGAIELGAVLEAYTIEVAKEAMRLAEHRGAKTITEADVRAAASGVRG